MRQVRASTLPTPTQHAIVSPFGGAWRASGGVVGSGMSERVVHRLAARLTDPSAVFLCNVHTMAVAAGAPPRLRGPACAQSFAGPGPPSSRLTLAAFLFRTVAPIREALRSSSTRSRLKGNVQWAASPSELATISWCSALG